MIMEQDLFEVSLCCGLRPAITAAKTTPKRCPEQYAFNLPDLLCHSLSKQSSPATNLSSATTIVMSFHFKHLYSCFIITRAGGRVRRPRPVKLGVAESVRARLGSIRVNPGFILEDDKMS
ncbi:hypothetical protein QJS10_CPB22g00878 [Acorus calamus]|uniref:Uncharacterized protein n=1 Tax=Acorus calamus TaxID=4465 RepID=A0AAV9BYC6_ACOCL|nr:hypothetical protein QJS10_CPB22g00878 [Acorus calamus]